MEINATLIIQAINFLIAYGVLRKFFFKPVLSAIKKEDFQKDSLLIGIEKRTQELREKKEEKNIQWVQCQKYFAQHAPEPVVRFMVRSYEVSESRLAPFDPNQITKQAAVLQSIIIQKVSNASI